MAVNVMYAGQAVAQHQHDPIYYLQRVFGDQLTTGGAVQLYRSSHQGSDRSYARILVVDPATERVVDHRAFRRLRSLRRHLDQLSEKGSQYDVYICPNGYYSGGVRNGRKIPGWRFSTDNLRWLNDVVVDLDRKNVSPRLMALWQSDPQAFLRQLNETMADIGVANYLVVRTNPVYGLQLHVLLQPVRANFTWGDRGASSTLTFKTVSEALYNAFAEWGADHKAAKRPVQVFRVPGMERPSYPGYRVELLVDHQGGPRAQLYTLLRQLHELGHVKAAPMVRPTGRVRYLPCAGQWTLLAEQIQAERFNGMAKGQGRRTIAYKLALALFAEGRLHYPQKSDPEALKGVVGGQVAIWNAHNDPPLPASAITSAVESASRGCGRVTGETWSQVCAALGVKVRHPYAHKPAKARSERKRDHVAEVEQDLVDLLASYGGQWEGVQADLPAALESTGQSEVALRTIQRALAQLSERGIIALETRRGRGGRTKIELIAQTEAQENDSFDAPTNWATEIPPTANAGAVAPAGVFLEKRERWVGGGSSLVEQCQAIFGADLVVVLPEEDLVEVVAVGSGEIDDARERKGRMDGACRWVVKSHRARTRDQMRGLLAAHPVEVPAGAVLDLTGRLEALERRVALRRETQAWEALRTGPIGAADVRWLVGRMEALDDLRQLLVLAEGREMATWSSAHADALQAAQQRYGWLVRQERRRRRMVAAGEVAAARSG